MHKILFVCHGNICRSTMAQSVFAHLVHEAGRDGEFLIDSAATSREEIGNLPHPGTVAKLEKEGIPLVPHTARQISADEYDAWDRIVDMDRNNAFGLTRILPGDPERKCVQLLEFLGIHRDVADPWYTGDFDTTFRDIMAGCQALLAQY